jgi:hypothetical protein
LLLSSAVNSNLHLPSPLAGEGGETYELAR